MRREHYVPTLSSRDTREEWEAAGGKDTYQRARKRVDEILSKRSFILPAEVRERILYEIQDIVDQ
jgi:trimethylamine:corrinoid methyltransferase-like protein